MKKLFRLLIVLGLLMFTLTACGDDNSTPVSSNDDGIVAVVDTHLDFGCSKYSDSIDPVVNVNSSWGGLRYGVTECLFKFDDEVVAQPNLAESISSNEDATVWTITLKEGIKFSNGNDLTASAVVASIERLYAETDASIGGTGNSNPEIYLTYESIVADDVANTVTITCVNTTPNMAGILSYPYFAIVDVTDLDEFIVGTGPYMVTEDNIGISMELAANEYYREDVPYETVSIIYVDDNSTKTMALQSGDIDLVENITSADALAQLEGDADYNISTAAGVRTANAYMNFNSELSNDALRQAIMMVLDDTTMCEITVGGMYTEGISVLPSSIAYGYDELVDPYGFDKEGAIAILDAAGIIDTDGDGYREIDGVNIDLDYITFASRNLNDFAQAVTLQLNEIGIKTTLNIRDYDTALALQNAGEFDLISVNTITVGIGDPQDFLGTWYSVNAVNYGYYQNDEYDALYEELMVTIDEDRRLEIIIDLQQILIDDAATIVHGYYNSRLFSRVDSVGEATIATIDYYWLTTDITPAGY